MVYIYIPDLTSILVNHFLSHRYSFVPSGHTGITEVMMGDPCFENPCSYESVQKVFDHILTLTDVGEQREWTCVGCDGLPYTLGSCLQEDIHRCPTCTMEFMDRQDFELHNTHNLDSCCNTQIHDGTRFAKI